MTRPAALLACSAFALAVLAATAAAQSPRETVDVSDEQGGVAAMKALFGGRTPAGLRAALERQLRRPWPVIVGDWRRRVMTFAR